MSLSHLPISSLYAMTIFIQVTLSSSPIPLWLGRDLTALLLF